MEPDNKLDLHGHYVIEHIRDGEVIGTYEFDNDIVNEGKNLIFNVMFNGTTQVAANSWFLGLISLVGYSALAAADVMNSHAGWTEFVGYSGGARPAWGQGSASSQTITNGTATTFNLTATGTVKGIFVTSNSTISGTSGYLWATALFTADVPVVNGDQLKVTYTLNA